jgi:putative resolvase
MIKLSKFAKDLKVTKMTLWNWRKKGLIEFIKIGSINYVDVNTYNKFMGISEKKNESVVIYCRVSSTENKNNLESQRKRLESYCSVKGYNVSKVICEFGSGLNDERPKLNKLLEELNFTKIVVEHKDRLTRFGFNYIKTLLNTRGIEIEVINHTDDNEENLIEDFVSIITSFCARIYGKRRSKRKTEELIKKLK